MAAVTRGSALALVAALAGCGDGLRPEGYRGEPVHVVEGVLLPDPADGLAAQASGARLALFWTTRPEADAPSWTQDPATTAPFAPPARFTLPIYAAPATGEGGFAVGAVMAWRDDDGDGLRDEDEPWLGAAIGGLLVYADRPLPGGALAHMDLPAGFTAITPPLLCGAEPLEESAPDCPLPIGGACYDDAGCSPDPMCHGPTDRDPEEFDVCRTAATCQIAVVASRLPGGMCVILETRGLDTCAPQTRRVPVKRGSVLFDIGAADAVWLPACDDPAGCERSGYACAPGTGVCLPTPVFEVVATAEAPPRICVQAFAVRGNEPPPPPPRTR